MSIPEAYLTDLQGQLVATVKPAEMVTFGRDASNTLVLDDFSVSPQHGAIVYRGGAYVIERWSRGRVWVNSQNHPVEGSRLLQDQDRVLIGNRHAFVFHLKKPETVAAPPPAPAVVPPTVASPPPMPPEVPQTMIEGDAGSAPAAPVVMGEAAPMTMLEAEAPAEAAPAPEGEARVAPEAVEGAEILNAEEPTPAKLDTGFMPAWERSADARSGAPAGAGAEAEPFAGPTPIAEGAPAPEETLVDQPAPPAPVPDWASRPPAASADLTPPEGISIPPSGWEQALADRPAARERAAPDDEVWSMRQRSEARRLIQEAIHMLRQGYVERARQKLNQALRLNESNEDAWLWLAAAEQDADRRRGALQRVLTINPNNVTADWGLISMQVSAGQGVEGVPSWQQVPSTAPGVSAYSPARTPTGDFYAPFDDTLVGSSSDSIPALLRQEEPRVGRGRAWAARILGVIGLVMLGAALFLPYGVWRIETFALWNVIPPLGEAWTGLQVWGYVGFGAMALAALFLLLIRASGGPFVGVVLTIIGLAIIFMAVLPILFGVITEPQVGAVVWGAAGLPLMLAGLLKIW